MAKNKNTFDLIYEIVKQIPYGRVTTYGQIACLLGNPRMSRVVGYALHVGKDWQDIPYHRVVNRMGSLSPVFIVDGLHQQRLLLEEEGVPFREDGTVEMEQAMWYGLEI